MDVLLCSTYWLRRFWNAAIRRRRPLHLRKKCVKSHILLNVKHTDVMMTVFLFSHLFVSVSSSLLLTLDTFSPHFTLKKHLHIWVALASSKKNKSGNKDTKWPGKMAKKWALQSDHLWGSGQPKCVFQITLWTKSVLVPFCGIKYPNLVSVVLMPKSELGPHGDYWTADTPLSLCMLGNVYIILLYAERGVWS